jgi:hypothetical protein
MWYSMLLINMVVALWIFYDSQKRGASIWAGLFWAVGVFFLLVIFLPLYMITRRKKGGTPAGGAMTADPPTSACPYCRQPYPGQPNFCPRCGQSLKVQFGPMDDKTVP